MIHEFELIIDDADRLASTNDEAAFNDFCVDIFEAGCDDSTPGISCGVVTVGFSREADSLEAAIRSAISDVQSAGYSVARVEIEPPSFVDDINAQLAKGTLLTS